MASQALKLCAFTLFILIVTSLVLPTIAESETPLPEQCLSKSAGACHDRGKALKLKIIAIISILIASMTGVSLPILSRAVPALHPDRNLFSLVKAFASGVILATGYMHVLPDAFDCLRSECLPHNPWMKFPFTTFVAMVSALMTLMVDSFSMSYHRKKCSGVTNNVDIETSSEERKENGSADLEIVGNSKSGSEERLNREGLSQLLRNRVVAQVLELGIIVHSVVIGLSMGASDNPCTIRPMIAALCFHQLFEGMGLGGCILQAGYPTKTNAIMMFFFSSTTPFGIALGIGLSNVYSQNSPTALIVVGVLNASSAGLLNYMALVDLLAADFLGQKLLGNMKHQMWAYAAVFSGAGLMSLMAKWA